jgi:hypothetical protein
MTFETWLAFALASLIAVMIPGPVVVFILGRALGGGWRASLPTVGGVALAKGGDEGGVEAESLQAVGQALFAEGVDEATARAVIARGGGGAAVADDAGLETEAAGVKGGA